MATHILVTHVGALSQGVTYRCCMFTRELQLSVLVKILSYEQLSILLFVHSLGDHVVFPSAVFWLRLTMQVQSWVLCDCLKLWLLVFRCM